jgi:class 3 adenylate cyclase
MELLADRDPEEARTILDPVLTLMMDAVHHYEGTVNQVMGDGIMALFGAPLAHEDHAVRACYAALRMQDAVRRYSDELRRAQGVEVQIRVGVNSGEVVVRSIGSDLRMDYTAVGQTTHLAARMEQLAAPGSIRLTAETLHLAEGFVQVTPLGPVPIKGLGEPVEVFEIESREWDHHALGRACLLLGRLDEAQRLGRRAVESSRSQFGFAAHAHRFDAESGEAHYRKALALAEPRGMRPLVAHCDLGRGRLYRRTGKRQESQEHLATASAMYREMDMRYWREQAGAELGEFAH